MLNNQRVIFLHVLFSCASLSIPRWRWHRTTGSPCISPLFVESSLDGRSFSTAPRITDLYGTVVKQSCLPFQIHLSFFIYSSLDSWGKRFRYAIQFYDANAIVKELVMLCQHDMVRGAHFRLFSQSAISFNSILVQAWEK